MKYTVLTYIFGDYELVREPVEVDHEAEYLLITDNANLKSRNWTVIVDERLQNKNPFDSCLYVRYHPFEYAHTDICLKIDGSIKIKSSLSPIIERFVSKKADLSLLLNPVHDNLFDDYTQWINTRNYPLENALKAKQKFESLGLPKDYKGYYQANFIIEKNNKVTKDINRKTYSLLQELGYDGHLDRLDQTVWSFVLNRYFSDKVNVMPVSEDIITFSKYLQWYYHNSNDAIPFKIDTKPTYLFNKVVNCEDFSYLGDCESDQKKIIFLKRCLGDSNNKLQNQEKKVNNHSILLHRYLLLKRLLCFIMVLLVVSLLYFLLIRS